LVGQRGLWVTIGLAFAFGVAAGVVLEFVVGVGSGPGAIAAVGGAVVIVASLVTVVVQEGFTRARERRLDLREHADLLNSQVYFPIQSAGTTIIGQNLSVPELGMDLVQRGVPDWGYRDAATRALVPVSELPNWSLARTHFETDPSLIAAFRETWTRLGERVTRKDAMDRLYLRIIAKRVGEVYGAGFPAGSGFTTPEPPRWFNGPTVTNWLRSGTTGYEFTEQTSGSQHRIIGGSMIVLTSDQTFIVPAPEFTRVLHECAADPDLQAAWRRWKEEDSRDQQSLGTFLRAVKHTGERIQATHAIPGTCEVCSR
jgi:hypothetical protein